MGTIKEGRSLHTQTRLFKDVFNEFVEHQTLCALLFFLPNLGNLKYVPCFQKGNSNNLIPLLSVLSFPNPLSSECCSLTGLPVWVGLASALAYSAGTPADCRSSWAQWWCRWAPPRCTPHTAGSAWGAAASSWSEPRPGSPEGPWSLMAWMTSAGYSTCQS